MANHFVVPGGAGTKDGSSWLNAYSADMSQVFNTIVGGDTVWLAGGTYTESFNMSQSPGGGTAGNILTYQKVLSTDPTSVTSGVAGWQPSFGTSICTFSGTDNGGLNGNNGYLTFNGRVPNGFYWPNIPQPFGGSLFNGSNVNNISFIYCTFIGPGWNSNLNAPGPTTTIQIFTGSGHYFGHCVFDGLNGCILNDGSGMTIEYCQFLNVSGVNPAAHPDSIYNSGCANLIIRYCYFYQSIGESVFFDFGTAGPIYFYGNVASCGPLGSGQFFSTKDGLGTTCYQQSNIFIYNNTFSGNWGQPVYMRGPPSSQPFTIKNNIYWNNGPVLANDTPCGPMPAPVSDYNGYNTGIPGGWTEGSHSINNTTNPFVNSSDPATNSSGTGNGDTWGNASNFALVNGAWPINAGVNLGPPYNTDMFGNTGNSMGALQVSGASPPVAPGASGIGSIHSGGNPKLAVRPLSIIRF